MKRIGLYLVVIGVLVALALAATADSGLTKYKLERSDRGMSRIIWAVQSEGGKVDLKTDRFYTGQIVGVIIRCASATSNFTDDYDVQLLDDLGFDLLDGKGTDQPAFFDAVINHATLGWVVGERLRLNISNAGVGKLATAEIWIRNEY